MGKHGGLEEFLDENKPLVLYTEMMSRELLIEDLVYYGELASKRGYKYWEAQVDDSYFPPYTRIAFFDDRKDLTP